MRAEVVVDGIPFGEGPVWCPDRTLVVTSVAEGALYRVWPEQSRAERIADTGGGANGAALASDGGFLVTQNGGFDFAATGLFTDPPPFRPAVPGLQRVLPDGGVSYLTPDPLQAPNDLAVRADGTVVFTDPGPFPPPDPTIARVLSWTPDDGMQLVADGFWYVNGIAFEPDGGLVVVERSGLLRLDPSGANDHEWVIENLGPGGGDGFCLDVDGRFYVCSTIEHCVLVIDRDGSIVERLAIEGEGLTTNCCFGGDDGRTLFATDALPGRVVAWDGMPTPGLALPSWPVGMTSG
ncbi:MAG: gluconolactonase [Acidimicrobiaceae bacterium]